MHCEDTKILETNQCQKSDKPLFINYEDIECLIEKIDECKIIPENWSMTKVGKHKNHIMDYNLLTAQDLWKAYYQTLLTILLKEFIK